MNQFKQTDSPTCPGAFYHIQLSNGCWSAVQVLCPHFDTLTSLNKSVIQNIVNFEAFWFYVNKLSSPPASICIAHLYAFQSECVNATFMFIVSFRDKCGVQRHNVLCVFSLFPFQHPPPPHFQQPQRTYRFPITNLSSPFLLLIKNKLWSIPKSCYVKDNNAALPVTLETAALFEMTVTQSF